jgi:transaldolase
MVGSPPNQPCSNEATATMKFFADTADLNEIRELADMGLLDGVTTNPSLVAKAGGDFKQSIAEICKMVDGPVSAEVVALDADGMIAEGRHLARSPRTSPSRCRSPGTG